MKLSNGYLFCIGMVLITSAAKNRHLFKPIPNNVIFEKIDYQVYNKTLVIEDKFFIKPVAPNIYRVNGSFTLTRPVYECWIRLILNYKYNAYQKYLIDQSGELCSLLNFTTSNPVAQLALDNFLLMQKDIEMNFKLECPIKGHIWAASAGFNMSKLTIPLLQSGRYRLDVAASPHERGPVYAGGQLYFRISDYRVWF